MRWIGGGTLRAAAEAQDGQSARERSSASARANIGASSIACVSTSSTVCGFRNSKTNLERKGMLLAQRDDDAVVGGGGLQFEIERAAEALAQRQSPGAIDARSERRMDDELHAAGFVEEALGDDGRLRRQRAQRMRAPATTYATACSAPRSIQRRTRRTRNCIGAIGHGARSLRAAAQTSRDSSRVRPGASPLQNGIDGARAVRILHAHASRLRRAGCARKWCPAGRRRRPGSRPRSLRRAFRPCLPSGSATTRYFAVSGIAPPDVMAASRAPRRPRTRSFT